MIINIVFLIVCLFILYILIPWGFKILIRDKFLLKIKKSGCVCLTFDDGPNPKTTPNILKLLEEKNIKATFFLLGKNAEKYPNIVKDIINGGHEIGEHSYKHTHAWITGPIFTAVDLIKGERVLKRMKFPHKINLIRPPYGKFNFVTLLYVWLRKKRVAFWNIDPEDFANSSSQSIAEYVLHRLNSGSVVLFHDARKNTSRPADLTVEAIKLILEKSSDVGFHFMTISKALNRSKRT